MLIYSYKGKVCPTSTSTMNEKNVISLLRYYRDILNKGDELDRENLETLLRQVFNTYSTLCNFNNLLTHDDITSSLRLLDDYLKNNEDVMTSIDNKCRSIYERLGSYYKRLSANTNSLHSIKIDVVSMMKFYAKFGIFKESSINLKSNSYDYV